MGRDQVHRNLALRIQNLRDTIAASTQRSQIRRQERERSYRLRWWTFWATFGTFLAVAAYTAVMFAQWRTLDATFREIGRQTDSSKRTARTAEEAVNQAREQFRQDQRPYIWLTGNAAGHIEFMANPGTDPPSGQIIWTYRWTNYGKSPAYDLSMFRFMRAGLDGAFEESHKANRARGAPLTPNEETFNAAVSKPGVTRAEYDRLLGIDRALELRLRFQYTDSYGCRYESRVCVDRMAMGSMQYCPEENSISGCSPGAPQTRASKP